jgi:HlyD family secretion protein
VRFTVDAFPNRSFQGQVQQIRLNPTTQQNVVTYNVRVSLSNPDHILLPGMTAYVSIAVASRDDACWCPTRRCVSSPARRRQQRPTSWPAVRRRRPAVRPAAPARQGQGQEARHRQRHRLRVDQGELKPVSVQLGITDNRNTEVLGGELKAGDKVIIGENIAGNGGKPSSVGMRLF